MSSDKFVELKYRDKSNLRVSQMYFSQTPRALFGNCTTTEDEIVIHGVNIRDKTAQFKAWECKHQRGLQKMHTLLQRFRNEVGKSKHGICFAISDALAGEDKTMELFEVDLDNSEHVEKLRLEVFFDVKKQKDVYSR